MKIKRMTAAALAASLLFGACGDDEGDDAATSDGTTTTAEGPRRASARSMHFQQGMRTVVTVS